MNYKSKLIAILFFVSTSMHLDTTPIKHVFIDINAVVKTDSYKASHHVGVINSMRYMGQVGHTPGKADYFKALKDVPSLTNKRTYNEDLAMPTILSDWLLGLQTNETIKSKVYQQLDKNNLSAIENTIFKNIVSMMMSATNFIGTQYVCQDLSKSIQSLRKAGYIVHLIGNWDKESEPALMNLMNGHHLPDARHCYFSNKAKELKPNQSYFDQLLQHHGLDKKECLIVDVERKHAEGARAAGLASILLHDGHATQFKSELARLGIAI